MPRKGSENMKIKIFGALCVGIFIIGCANMMSLEEREKSHGKSIPEVREYFASKDLRPGDTWKIYLKAFDPDGDMKYIVATISQPGMGIYPVSYTAISKGHRKELSGYVYLNTGSGHAFTFNGYFFGLILTIQIQDRAGHYSKPVEIPLSFDYRAGMQGAPPQGDFKDQDLGPIMIPLRPMSAENTVVGLPSS